MKMLLSVRGMNALETLLCQNVDRGDSEYDAIRKVSFISGSGRRRLYDVHDSAKKYLAQLTPGMILRIRSCGQKTTREIIAALARHGIHLGTSPGEPIVCPHCGEAIEF